MLKRLSVLIYIIAMLFLSLKPVGPKIISIPYIFYLQHFIAYTAFVIVVAYAVNNKQVFYTSCSVIIFFSGLIEIIQPRFGRESSIWDFVANCLGVSLGILVVYLLRKVRWRKHQRLSYKVSINW
ncbi:VanZ family protein [Photobacterium sp. DA100]|uniref:VanZ family protein n=1 Tax=Photobacterium sp. DA100 TaxID=3027472 RepID=UPI002478A565|nr:VanZ family protein [Photobacterium sp. DA100]WEM41561.1 VanZ family protein [Photobacterium sp. DA100]